MCCGGLQDIGKFERKRAKDCRIVGIYCLLTGYAGLLFVLNPFLSNAAQAFRDFVSDHAIPLVTI
jgi:hypothetical protein